MIRKRHRTAHQIRHDDHWVLASHVQITPSPLVDADTLGVVCARRNPTGWFISARVRDGLNDADRAVFQEFVGLRVHALLSNGPASAGWTSTGPDEWTEAALACIDVDATAQVPDAVPPHWSRSTSGAPTN